MFAPSISTVTLDPKRNPVDTIQHNARWLLTWKRKKENKSIDVFI